MAATIKDIARMLNISISTVSYALNDGPVNVNEDIKRKVLETAKELGYRPNRIARSLASGKSMILGVASFEMSEYVVTSAHFQGCLKGIVTVAKRLGYDILLYTHDAQDQDELVSLVTDGRVDGLIAIAPFVDSGVIARVTEGNVPVTILSGLGTTGTPTFNCDNRQGVRLAIEHLIGLGHSKIAHIAGADTMSDSRERTASFTDLLEEHGIPVRQDWIVGYGFDTEVSYKAALGLLAGPGCPSAIVCASDDNAAGVYRAAWELGINIPDELSVVGFDDSQVSEVLAPRLTSVRQPLQAMGAAATRALLALFEKHEVSSQLFETELIVRQSTARVKSVKTQQEVRSKKASRQAFGASGCEF